LSCRPGQVRPGAAADETAAGRGRHGCRHHKAGRPAAPGSGRSAVIASRSFGIKIWTFGFDIRDGECKIGPNGAGKTTLLNVSTGVLPPSSGTLTFEGHAVAGLPPHRCCHLGIARTFQIPQVFSSMTIEDNVATGAIFGTGAQVADAGTQVSEVLDIVGLAGQRHQPASRADLLTRKRIMLAAALATRPKLVFLDEPLSGLNTEEVDVFVGLFHRLQPH
jgi:branched-chain amino acid transport system ATP-binding protein